jgi:hypothetical protein
MLIATYRRYKPDYVNLMVYCGKTTFCGMDQGRKGKNLLQIKMETRRFKNLFFSGLARITESTMSKVYRQFTSRFFRRIRRPGFSMPAGLL